MTPNLFCSVTANRAHTSSPRPCGAAKEPVSHFSWATRKIPIFSTRRGRRRDQEIPFHCQRSCWHLPYGGNDPSCPVSVPVHQSIISRPRTRGRNFSARTARPCASARRSGAARKVFDRLPLPDHPHRAALDTVTGMPLLNEARRRLAATVASASGMLLLFTRNDEETGSPGVILPPASGHSQWILSQPGILLPFDDFSKPQTPPNNMRADVFFAKPESFQSNPHQGNCLPCCLIRAVHRVASSLRICFPL